jgi:glycerol uptake facilitator-like aquaporin
VLLRKVVAEALGTALLLAAIVGSGIMAEELARPNVALALLANTVATGAALVALIITFGPISGAHFNPVVTIADASQGGLPWRAVPAYVVAQIVALFWVSPWLTSCSSSRRCSSPHSIDATGSRS